MRSLRTRKAKGSEETRTTKKAAAAQTLTPPVEEPEDKSLSRN